MTRVFIVRHGNTFLPTEPPRRIGARTDLALTDEGISQGEALGALFQRRGVRFDRILASPLLRTRRTAELIAARQTPSARFEIATWLAEIDHGIDEGVIETRVAARLGEAVLSAWDTAGVPPPDWPVEPEKRRDDWRRFFADARSGDVLVVTSNGIARFGLMAALPLIPLESMRLRTGAFGVIEQTDGGDRSLLCWDRRP